jgi:RNA polymerase sigma-70 factor, ECF subfamily
LPADWHAIPDHWLGVILHFAGYRTPRLDDARERFEETVIMDQEEFLPLVLQAQAGDREAFGQLALAFESTVFAIAMRRLRNQAEAAELTQDVFIQALRKLPQLREAERFPGWLRRITVRLSINRAVRRPPVATQDSELFGSINCDRQSPLDSAMNDEQAAHLRGGLKRLKELDRTTLVAFYFEGQSLIEMSDRFQSPVGTIKRRLHTARIRLRDELAHLQPI